MTKEAYMKLIEEISLNAWPSHKIELYDGWLIRFSHNYTYRTNSVEQVGNSLLPVEEKIAYCEKVYADFHTPANFKINPLLAPSFDALLERRGYQVRHVTEVMTLSEEAFSSFDESPEDSPVQLENRISDNWISSLFRLNGTADATLRRIVPSMFHAIPKETIAASITADGRMVASGLGILDREHVGLYAIYVDASFRRRHFARSICRAILSKAREKGAKRAYLQVKAGNTAAKNLYISLGFEDFYTYWFRSLEQDEHRAFRP